MKLIGNALFWLGWPFFFVYFKIWSRRTRIIVVQGNKLLLLRGWIGDGSWGLPGGGAHIRESALQAAVRELREETGIRVPPELLRYLAEVPHRDSGLKYTALYFRLELTTTPGLVRQKKEIAQIGWFEMDALRQMELNTDARYAVERFLGA